MNLLLQFIWTWYIIADVGQNNPPLISAFVWLFGIGILEYVFYKLEKRERDRW